MLKFRKFRLPFGGRKASEISLAKAKSLRRAERELKLYLPMKGKSAEAGRSTFPDSKIRSIRNLLSSAGAGMSTFHRREIIKHQLKPNSPQTPNKNTINLIAAMRSSSAEKLLKVREKIQKARQMRKKAEGMKNSKKADELIKKADQLNTNGYRRISEITGGKITGKKPLAIDLRKYDRRRPEEFPVRTLGESGEVTDASVPFRKGDRLPFWGDRNPNTETMQKKMRPALNAEENYAKSGRRNGDKRTN